MNYEIQSRNQKTYKHTFDYEACKKKYLYYANMDKKEFMKALKKRKTLGEIQHLSMFILFVKNKPRHEYRQTLSDYGLLHLLAHCVENKHDAKKYAKQIHELFTTDIKLS